MRWLLPPCFERKCFYSIAVYPQTAKMHLEKEQLGKEMNKELGQHLLLAPKNIQLLFFFWEHWGGSLHLYPDFESEGSQFTAYRSTHTHRWRKSMEAGSSKVCTPTSRSCHKRPAAFPKCGDTRGMGRARASSLFRKISCSASLQHLINHKKFIAVYTPVPETLSPN